MYAPVLPTMRRNKYRLTGLVLQPEFSRSGWSERQCLSSIGLRPRNHLRKIAEHARIVDCPPPCCFKVWWTSEPTARSKYLSAAIAVGWSGMS